MICCVLLCLSCLPVLDVSNPHKKTTIHYFEYTLKLTLTLSFWKEPSQSPGTFIVDQPSTNQSTDRLTAEELKCSCHRARWHQHPTNHMFEVWQNLALFNGRPIGGAIEVLLTKVVNRQSSGLPIAVFFCSHGC
jgi:hypothetical protein